MAFSIAKTLTRPASASYPQPPGALTTMARERIVQGDSMGDDESRVNYALRPLKFDQYIGQEQLIRKLKIAVSAARQRKEPVDHCLLHGPPGLGKTTLAHVVANEVGAQAHVTNGPALTKGADLVGILTKLNYGDVLFIDEIHRLSAVVEEYLYPAMEDFKVDITLDQGAHARTVNIPLPPFTLIGATTRIGLLTGPMRGRFGISEHIEFYTPESLHEILRANCKLLNLDAEMLALRELAARSRGTPRVANRLLRRGRGFAAAGGGGEAPPPRSAGGDRVGGGGGGLPGGGGEGKAHAADQEGAAEARRHRREGARRAGPRVPAHDHRVLQRRPRRRRRGGSHDGRGARHDRGRDRA